MPPPALFFPHVPARAAAPTVSHTSPARALPPVGAFRIEFPSSPARKPRPALFFPHAPRLRGAPASPTPAIFPHALHPAHPRGY